MSERDIFIYSASSFPLPFKRSLLVLEKNSHKVTKMKISLVAHFALRIFSYVSQCLHDKKPSVFLFLKVPLYQRSSKSNAILQGGHLNNICIRIARLFQFFYYFLVGMKRDL